MKGDKGPADIILTENKIKLNNEVIPSFKVGQSDPIRKVTLADNYVIPARSEVIVDVFIDRFDTDTKDNPTELLIEPHTQFTDRYPLRMASCLVDPSQTVTNEVRLLNPFNNEIEIVQNTVLGTAEEIEGSPVPLFNEKDSEENSNFNSLRRILQILKPV
ncbi:unnamed protein product [Mytilus coruscus]|uniref:Uncharacterized protein n=1 Tax=Mytilus coruscus TaxID=42192 RepID=A0A6J8CAG4_MYTCO|nr:unnamed protein product [Mytilus coruscus]